MKKIIFAAIVSILAIACSKSTDKKTKLPDPNAMQYRVDGLTNIIAMRRGEINHQINIVHTGGRQERLHLSISGLPPGISYELSPKAGTPAFSSMLHLEFAKNASLIDEGVITLTAKTESGETKNYDLPIRIIPEGNCLPELSWRGYWASSNCFPNSSVTIDDTEVPNQLEFYSSEFGTLFASVDCVTDSLYFLKHTQYNGSTIEGVGSFTDSTFDINLILADTSGNKTECNIHISEL